MKYSMDMIQELLEKNSKLVDDDLNTFFSFLINDNNMIKNIWVENLTDKLVINSIQEVYNAKFNKQMVVNCITKLIDMGFITRFNHPDSYTLILTNKFYDEFIENYEVTEDELPKDYENVEKTICDYVKSLVDNDNEIPLALRAFNNRNKLMAEKEAKRQKKLASYVKNFVKKNLVNN